MWMESGGIHAAELAQPELGMAKKAWPLPFANLNRKLNRPVGPLA